MSFASQVSALATRIGQEVKAARGEHFVLCATTGNITLSGTQTIDGVAAVAGDRVLVRAQTLSQNNGIYIVAAGAWARATDANTALKIAGKTVAVQAGTLYGGIAFYPTFLLTDTLGTTAMTWYQWPATYEWPYIVREANTSQSFTTSSVANVNFGVTVSSRGSWSAAATTVTVPMVGLYVVTFHARWNTGAASRRYMEIRVNGVGIGIVNEMFCGASGGPGATMTAEINLTSGDTVGGACYQNSGGNLTLDGSFPARLTLSKVL